MDDVERSIWYLKHKGVKCPFCKSDKIGDAEISNPNMTTREPDQCVQHIKCCDCGKTWKDIYRLEDVEFYDEEE